MNRTAVSRVLPRELGVAEVVDDLPALRILLAESNDDLRLLLGLVLRCDGHQVVEVSQACELLAHLASTRADPHEHGFDLVIVSQHGLPGLLALSVLASIRFQSRHVPLVLMTPNANVQEAATRLGAVILDRPFTIDSIRGAIARATGYRSGTA